MCTCSHPLYPLGLTCSLRWRSSLLGVVCKVIGRCGAVKLFCWGSHDLPGGSGGAAGGCVWASPQVSLTIACSSFHASQRTQRRVGCQEKGRAMQCSDFLNSLAPFTPTLSLARGRGKNGKLHSPERRGNALDTAEKRPDSMGVLGGEIRDFSRRLPHAPGMSRH